MSRAPHAYPDRVLLAVTGLTPQIVTETVYVLAVERKPVFVPTEIRVLTTAEGAERVRFTLLSHEPGWFRRLCAMYDLDGIRFDDDCVEVLCAADGRPLDDIRDAADSARAADQITDRIRALTADDDRALHVSLAGGRKTLGFYAGYALSLYGRPQDRLSHVLVSPPFESNQAFFFPTRESTIIYTAPPHDRPIDARDARVTLAEIPFVRLRQGIPDALIAGRARFSETVRAVQRAFAAPALALDPATRRVRAGETVFALPPADFAFLAWMARRRIDGEPPLSCPSEVGEGEPAAAFLDHYEAVGGQRLMDERTRESLRQGMDRAYFESRKSRLNAALKRALGATAGPYLVQRFGRRPTSGFGLALAPRAITFGPFADDGPADRKVASIATGAGNGLR